MDTSSAGVYFFMAGISKTKHTSQAIDNMSFDDELKVKIVELIGADGVLKNPSTEETSSNIKDALIQISNLTESIRKMTQSIQRPVYLNPSDGRLNISNILTLNYTGINQIYMPTGFVANANTASYMLTEGYDLAKSRWYLNTRNKL